MTTPPYIVRSYRHIHGENFIIEEDEIQTALETAAHRAALAKARRECEHDFGMWHVYDRLTERRCKKCRKVEYK